ncbi:MAG: hypothetical protein AAF735_08005 [Myxococcota bacterium]
MISRIGGACLCALFLFVLAACGGSDGPESFVGANDESSSDDSPTDGSGSEDEAPGDTDDGEDSGGGSEDDEEDDGGQESPEDPEPEPEPEDLIGNGVCDDGETAASVPQDCPSVSGDGLCTEGENAETTPVDCPPISGDGFCTHSESFETEPVDCPPPSFSATDATLDNLRAVSPDLVFDRLTITGELALGNPRGREVYILANSISFGSNSEISWSQGTCDYFDGPDLVLEAVDTAELLGFIGLRGKSGVSSLSSATCNDCNGTDGGSLVVSATNIRLAGLHDLGGGQSSNSRVTFPGGSVTVACDGADGGSLELLGQNEVQVASRTIQNGGKGGLGEFGSDDDGDLGQKGQLLISGPPEQLIRFIERDDANALQTSAQRIPFKPLTLNGQIEPNDDSGTSNSRLFVNGFPVPDLFVLTNDAGGVEDLVFNFRMEWTSFGETDVNFFLFSTAGQLFGGGFISPQKLVLSTGQVTSSTTFTVSDVQQGEELILAVGRLEQSQIPVDYEIRVTTSPSE